MNRTDETEVLVVGAGPVGMFTAWLLAEKGVDVTVIDKERRTAAHSYACALHPGTLQLLDRSGLAGSILALGRRIDRLAFYEGAARRAEINLADVPGPFSCAVVLPQSAFEWILEDRIHHRSGGKIHWNHRLSDLEFGQDSVVASIDKLVQTSKGYTVPDWDWTVDKKLQITAKYVVGADGHHSVVRSRLGIDYDRLAPAEWFSVFEFETDCDPGCEARVAIGPEGTNALWPLPGHRARWSFQLPGPKETTEFPPKDREAVRFVRAAADQKAKEYVARLASQRAPWFESEVKDVEWSVRIRFEHRLARQFGKGRGWLAGDAAHQTGPVGVQSMNAGLHEAADLAARLARILREDASPEILDAYAADHRRSWEKLLAASSGDAGSPAAGAWAKEHQPTILSCIPACGADLAKLAGQVGLEFHP